MFRGYKYGVSIVMPVYNSENYISECLDSILSQTFSDLEIIIVDDGSTDNTAKILEEYQHTDERIQVIWQQNSGPGAARNLGIINANGYAIMFMDSDDFYSGVDVIETVFNKWIESNVDVLVFNGKAFTDNGTGYYKWAKNNYYHLDKTNGERVEKGVYFIEQTNGQIQQPGMKICEKQFIIENEIFFQNSKCGVDLLFFYHLFIKAERVLYFDFTGYYRRYRADSIVTGASINNVLSRIQSFRELYALIDIIHDERSVEIIKKQFLYYICLLWTMAFNRQQEDRNSLMEAFDKAGLAEVLKLNKMDFVTRVFSVIINTPKQFIFIKIAFARIIRIVFKKKSNLFV